MRVCHWGLVGAFALAWLTGEESQGLHEWAGYAAVALIAVRVVWGFVGTKYARFTQFVRGPDAVLAYAGDTFRHREARYLGHNPAGGAMVITLLATLVVLCATGVMMTTDAFWGVKWVDDVHNLASNFSLILIGIHVTGVIIASLEHKENLIIAMITGWKRTR